MRLVMGLSVASFAWCASAPLVAIAAPTARLVYSRTPDASSCPDEGTLRRAVATRIGYDPFFPWAPKVIVAHMAKEAGGGFVVTIDLIDESGFAHGAHALRSAAACDELLEPAALAIAIAIDPHRLLAETSEEHQDKGEPRDKPPSPERPPVPEVQPAPPQTAESPPPPPQEEPGSVGFEIGAGVFGSSGVAPGPTAGGTLLGAAIWNPWSLELDLDAILPASRAAPHQASGSQRTVSSWVLHGTLAPCLRAFGGIEVCALGQLGALQAWGEPTGKTATGVLTAAAGGRVGFVTPVWGTALLRVRTDLLRSLRPVTYEFDGSPVWMAPDFAFSFGVDLRMRFP